ncbi:MAG: hypothetical protein M0P71_06160 [Melioribacteraceae bacterium]|nr:hypothetical protein [Melioribacteraceae bacterium]
MKDKKKFQEPKYGELKTPHKRKKEKILPKTFNSPHRRIIEFNFGSVWGIPDGAVPFDNERKKDDYKDCDRPCVVISKPIDMPSNEDAIFAPGTTHYHDPDHKINIVLYASNKKENLKYSTYFLLYFKFSVPSKFINSKFCDLSKESKNQLKLLVEMNNG